MNENIGGLMQQLLGVGAGAVPEAAREEFHQVAQQASPESLSQGIAAAFNSEQTPSFGSMVAHMFGQANPDQKTGIVNRLIGGMGPSAAALLSQLGLSGLAGQANAVTPNLTTDQAAQLSTGQVQQIATQAQSVNPGIVGTMSNFYAQHPVLVKTLGAVALSMVLGRIGRGR